MRRVAAVILTVVVVLLQMSILPVLRPFGVVPDLMLVLVVLMGFEGSASAALTVAVAGGIVLDLVGGTDFGLWTAILTLAALATGVVHRAGLESRSIWAPAVVVAGATILMAAVLLLGLLNGPGGLPLGSVAGRMLIEVIINLLLMLGSRPLIRWMATGLQAGVMSIG